MYKDVKKKLLAVALCICMIIGVVEVVPRVRAAATSNPNEFTVEGQFEGTGDVVTFTVRVRTTTFVYDGTAHTPEITSVTCTDPSETCTPTMFNLTGREAIDVGHYEYKVIPNGNSWELSETDTIPFDITPASARSISAAYGELVVDYANGTVVYPGDDELNVTINGNVPLKNTDAKKQFALSNGGSAVGIVDATLDIIDPNYEKTSAYRSATVTYVIAYNLGTGVGCSAHLTQQEYPYNNGAPVSPEMTITGGANTFTVSDAATHGFQIKYEKISRNADGNITGTTEVPAVTAAGEYYMVVSPVTGEPYVEASTGVYFTGTYREEFSVTRLDTSSLTVTAHDANGRSVTLSDPNYILKLPYAGAGKDTIPDGIVVEDRTGEITSLCKIEFQNADRAGVAYILITPDPDRTDYTGTKKILYHITSDIVIDTFRLNGEVANQAHVVYDGKPHTVAVNDCVVKNKSGDTLSQGANRNYTLSVEYRSGNDWFEATTDEHLSNVGEKRIKATGHGVYEGKVAYQSFWIDPVDIDIEDYRKNVEVILDPEAYDYTGSAIMPTFRFEYNGIPFGSSDDPQGNFTFYATDNVDAGEATLVLKMSGTNFKGTYERKFTIRPLDIGYLNIVGDYVYDGTPKTAIFKITNVDYSLVPDQDYVLNGYRKQGTTDAWSKTAPTDAGTYEVSVQINTDNISCGKGVEQRKTYEVKKCNIADLLIIIDPAQTNENNEVEWSGGATEPDITGIPSYMKPSDYVVTYENNTQISAATGSAIIHVKASDKTTNFTGQKDIRFTIISRGLDSSGVKFDIARPTNLTPSYTLTLNVTDDNRSSDKRKLALGTDYEIQKILYYNDKTGNWEELQSTDSAAVDYYTTGTNSITGLKRAGKYRVTITGLNAYKGTKTAADVTCGTDISGHIVRIDSTISGITNYKVPYNGTDQAPTGFSLREKAGNHNVVQGVSYENGDYTVDYVRTDTYDKLLQDVGRIFVVAVGNPEKGYFGRTETFLGVEGSGYFYDITPAKWTTNDNFEIEVEDVTYSPREVQTPVVTLRFKTGVASGGGFVWKTLEPGTDYEITATNGITYDADGNIVLNNDLKNQGDKQITIVGKGNHEGNSRIPLYTVLAKNLTDSDIEVKANGVDYSSLKDVKFTISHDGYRLVKDKDYTQSQKNDPDKGFNPIPNDVSAGEDPGFHVFYTLTGIGNYTGKRVDVRVDVGIVDLEPERVWAPSREEAQVGQFYVDWKQSELLITSDQAMLPETQRTPINPTQLDIFYKISENNTVPLVQGVDYEIVANGYGKNYTAGAADSNYVTIQGIGGYSGTPKLKFKLYTDISGAQTAEESLIKRYADKDKISIVTKSEWLKIYDGTSGSDKDLLVLNKISIGEVGSIDPEEYELRWPTGFDAADPSVGNWTVRVVGTQKGEHCYYGDILIPFRVVNDINAATISVGPSNSVQYQGPNNPIVVTAPGIQANFRVTADGKDLRMGTDYEVVGYTANDRIGTATVTLRGIGDYSGTVDHDFKIVYPLASLVVFMQDPATQKYVNRAKENVTWPYTGNEIQPPIMLYCPLDFNGDATTDEEYLAKLPLDSSLYEVGYENNIHAGTGTVVIKNCPYFTGASGSTEGAQRGVTFSIVSGNIAPPAEGGTVSYKSTIHANVENIFVPYKGEHYTVDDLGIVLEDHGQTLKENVDYVVYYDGDTLNVSDPVNKPMITFSGIGNYGGKHEIHFTIDARSLQDAEISVDPIQMTYTDQATEQAIIKQMNVQLRTPTGSMKKLVYGSDFEIVNYFSDAQCNRPVQAANGVLSESGQYYIPTKQGTYYARINGIGNFKNTREITIEISKKDLTNDIKINFIPSADSDCMIDNSGEPDCTYNGKQHKPAISVMYGRNNALLRPEDDYTFVYEENVNAGTAKVTVTMTPGGNYDGTFSRTFTIKPKSILKTEGGTILYSQINESYPFDPAVSTSIKPEMTVRDSEMGQDQQELARSKDYTIEYKAESAAIEKEDGKPECTYGGKVVIEINGMGNYTGTQKFVYYIGEDIGAAYVEVNGSGSMSTVYNGLKQLIPDSSIQVKTNESDVDLVLPDGTKRYGYAYYKGDLDTMIDEQNVVDAATYYIAVTGNPRLGTYAKSTISNSCVYTIKPRSISQSYILVSGYDASYYYTGQAIEPKGIVVEDTDLPVDDSTQRRSVKLISGTDYDLSYVNNVSAGKASIRVKGKGNYTGERDAYFTIVSSDTTGDNTWDGTSEGTGSLTNGTTTISANDIHLGFDSSAYNCMMYNGYERIPTVSIGVNGVSPSDFIVTASNNVAPGVATLIIQGAGSNYTGTIYKNYAIKADLGQYGVIAGIADQVYSGYQLTPSITLTCGGSLLNEGSDYTVTYANNTNVGRATVMAHATGNSFYVGTATSGFNISNAAGGMQITGYASAYTYTGYAITPDVVVTMNNRVLNRGTDYTVSYANNINVGTATMTVNGIGSYSGSKTINFTIEAKNIENCLTTAVDSYQYNGSTYTPVVTITDSSTGKTLIAGTDYTITYSNNTNPGTAQITVTALSKNYTGTKVIPFKITSAAVSGLRTSTIKNNSIKLAWSAQEYADGYQICNTKNRVIATTGKNSYTVKGLTSCTTYKFKVRSYVENADGTVSYGDFSTAISAKTLLNTPTLKAKATGGGKVTLTWTKVSKATGYEIYYSTKKNGRYTKLKTVSKSSKRRYVDKGLARGEKYYYTIRAYRTANGVKTYSNYNTIKSVRVK